MRDRFLRRERRGNEWIGVLGSLVRSQLRFDHSSVWNNGVMIVLKEPSVWWSF
jgi:hypothetical protein